jgi:hypothetical protein
MAMTGPAAAAPLLSILIPTIPSRRQLFERLLAKLRGQVASSSVGGEVEILALLDNHEHTVGAKRNRLVDQARGSFVAFVDDDDDVSDRYVPLICTALREHPDIDCVGIKGTVLFRGRRPRTFIHSLAYRAYGRQGDTLVRPPYHLNPMRRAIACRYRFEDVGYSEDVDWAMRICRDGALRREYFLDEVIYCYRSRRHWLYQWLLDRTECVRHVLGLQLANRVRARRWLRDRLGR